MKRILPALLLGITFAAAAAPKGPPPIISTGPDGKLIYGHDERGNRVPDFSTCGYADGDREIPNAPVRVVVSPIEGDETERIQKAIDYVAALPPDSSGMRGVVLLLKGRHEILGALQITNSGVVLRGQGMGDRGSILFAAGQDRRTLITILGRNDRIANSNQRPIADDYVPVGAGEFHLKDAGSLKPGDTVEITRPCTKNWIDSIDAEEFGGGDSGGWKPGSRKIVWDRVIKSVDGNLVAIDAPITTALETDFGGGYLQTYSWPGRIHNVGVENLRLESSFDPANPKDENHSWMAITMEDVQDAWVRQVAFEHFAGSAVAIYETCKRVTTEDCLSLAPISEIGGYRRDTFFTMGQQTLFLRCVAGHGRHDFSVGDCAAGPNAFVQCEANEALEDSGGIESWSSGTLFDNVRIDGNALTLGYRPGNEAGIGWAAANSVLWNCDASVIRCWNPPGAQNWSFGSWGSFEGNGVWRDSNAFVKPESLYVAQLAERTGRRAQIMSRSTKESTNPSVEEAAELIAASHRPAPQLSDYILAASRRNPIPDEPGSAVRVDDLPQTPELPAVKHHVFAITNGWLVCDGHLVVGGTMELTWWRGSIRPEEAPKFGPALSRFVPGRNGPGLTDNINDLADAMLRHGDAALDHHYGLWYDLRRDDHERVRRMTGDVLPPFFEQPFARSGQGTAWDGLSKYDLTKFNPWYWKRLKDFADLGEKRGLMLFNENYFQHNIIEAGAHWVDCPWRTANNINHTGFPEPPPFAGDKRIFMADQFYDAGNPARRALQRGFIRQNLDNFKSNSNVIQFTSAEFSGPVQFVQFWLDTIAEWKNENPQSKPLIALAAPKNVQDAILADAPRAAIVDIIVFRYWWRTDKGLYAPDGGLNLSPRQFQRMSRSGPPTDLNLAAMAAEYRAKFPAKPVIAASEQGLNLSHGAWAYVCAGGSMPNLPRTTDPALLAAIPRMSPWTDASTGGRWVLREPGKQYLVYSSQNAPAEFDLSSEQGAFDLRTVNARSGKIEAKAQTVQGGGKISLPPGIAWLTRAK